MLILFPCALCGWVMTTTHSFVTQHFHFSSVLELDLNCGGFLVHCRNRVSLEAIVLVFLQGDPYIEVLTLKYLCIRDDNSKTNFGATVIFWLS
jgi:hypothetical protein